MTSGPTHARRVAAIVLLGASLLLLGGARALDAARSLSARVTGESSDVCGFRAQYGVDCLGCGGTRAFAAVSRGYVSAAFGFNRLGAMIGLGTWALALASLISLLHGRLRVLGVTVAVLLALLPITMIVHATLWWRALPPGIRFG